MGSLFLLRNDVYFEILYLLWNQVLTTHIVTLVKKCTW